MIKSGYITNYVSNLYWIGFFKALALNSNSAETRDYCKPSESTSGLDSGVVVAQFPGLHVELKPARSWLIPSCLFFHPC